MGRLDGDMSSSRSLGDRSLNDLADIQLHHAQLDQGTTQKVAHETKAGDVRTERLACR
jgi:hypothetical protein